MAEASGLLHEGDEILEVNEVELRGKDVNEVNSNFTCNRITLGQIRKDGIKLVFPQDPCSIMHSIFFMFRCAIFWEICMER